MVEKHALTPSQIENQTRRNINNEECRCRQCVIAHQLEDKNITLSNAQTPIQKIKTSYNFHQNMFKLSLTFPNQNKE